MVVPRLLARLAGAVRSGPGTPRIAEWAGVRVAAPQDGAILWEDGRVLLTADAAGVRYRDLFTGELHHPAHAGNGQPALALATLFADFPVALLHREAS